VGGWMVPWRAPVLPQGLHPGYVGPGAHAPAGQGRGCVLVSVFTLCVCVCCSCSLPSTLHTSPLVVTVALGQLIPCLPMCPCVHVSMCPCVRHSAGCLGRAPSPRVSKLESTLRPQPSITLAIYVRMFDSLPQPPPRLLSPCVCVQR
jgi:hypothetical protein